MKQSGQTITFTTSILNIKSSMLESEHLRTILKELNSDPKLMGGFLSNTLYQTPDQRLLSVVKMEIGSGLRKGSGFIFVILMPGS